MNERKHTEKRKNPHDRRRDTDMLDKFALLAMQKLLEVNREDHIPFQRIAQQSYVAAKAMMATRAHFTRQMEANDEI